MLRRLPCVFLFLCFLRVGSVVAAETLQQFASKCDQAIGETVLDFNCDSGDSLIPTTNFVDGLCDRPNRLNRVCDQDSRFLVLKRTSSVDIVALCRKKRYAAGEYGDIAVIQHNKVNGNTCFYQSQVLTPGGTIGLSGQVTAPSKGNQVWPWLPVDGIEVIGCAGCHDNGPIIRSPYLTQITGPNALPGRSDNTYNRNQPYLFVGNDFAGWRTYKVTVPNNLCMSCHRMGVNNLGGGGASRDLGIRATGENEAAKNPHSPTSPIWMLPGQIFFQQSSLDAAQQVKNCAVKVAQRPLPNGPDCTITPVQGSVGSPLPPMGSPMAGYKQSIIITSTYQSILHRLPTGEEYSSALAYLLAGGTKQGLIGRLIGWVPAL